WSSPGMAVFYETWYQIKVGLGKNRAIAAQREIHRDKPRPYVARKFK
ncbi:enoyl-CoA hydratase, partial [Vibrio coralliirubri]